MAIFKIKPSVVQSRKCGGGATRRTSKEAGFSKASIGTHCIGKREERFDINGSRNSSAIVIYVFECASDITIKLASSQTADALGYDAVQASQCKQERRGPGKQLILAVY